MDDWRPPKRSGRGPNWQDGVSGWENAPEYGSGPIRWWFWPIAIAIMLAPVAWAILGQHR